MESPNYTEQFLAHLAWERKIKPISLCLAGSPRNAGASVLVQAHLCLYRMILICFQLPCLKTHLTNPFPSVFVLLPQFSVLILMVEVFPFLIFQPRMPISSTHYWLPIQVDLCPTGSCITKTPPLMHLGQHVSFQHYLRPISQKHFPKQLPVRMELQVAWGIPQHLFVLALVQMRHSCLTH